MGGRGRGAVGGEGVWGPGGGVVKVAGEVTEHVAAHGRCVLSVWPRQHLQEQGLFPAPVTAAAVRYSYKVYGAEHPLELCSW